MKFQYHLISIIFLITLLLVSIASCTSKFTPSSTTNPTQSSFSLSPTEMTPTEVQWQPDGAITSGEYLGSNNYDSYSIYWRSDGQYLYIGMTAKTNGWVSMALQPGSRMKDSDMVLGYVKDGKAEVQDLYCTDNLGSHPEDTELGGSDDILSFGGKEEGGFTTIEFKRSLNASDKYDISIIKGVNKIIWAYGLSDSLTIKHLTRGYGEINP
jgi:hypothetical protein